MKSESGEYLITPAELEAFAASDSTYIWLNADGTTTHTDTYEPAAGWPVYLGSFGPPWFAQWDGDLERACAEQLNPLLRAAQPRLPSIEEGSDA